MNKTKERGFGEGRTSLAPVDRHRSMDRSAQHAEEKPRQKKHDLMLTFLGSPSPPSSDMTAAFV
jgi:hypothetical protein